MKLVDVNEVAIGSIIIEPIIVDGVLLCKAGTPVSKSIKKILPNFGINEVVVSTVFTDKIDRTVMNFNKLDQLMVLSLKALDIDDIVMCSRELVRNMIDCDCNDTISILYDYDIGTYHHSKNVAVLALAVGIRLGMTKNELRTLATGALLHDIGKSVIPTTILNKEGKLDKNEAALMRQHPLIGAEMVKSVNKTNSGVVQIILQHHENYDGTGYPKQLYGLNSYRSARLVHICDVYEALCAKRPYKDNISRKQVRKIMRENSGTMFDSALLNVFLDTIPLYFVGEEVTSNGRKGTILNNDNKKNPIVYCNGEHFKLSEFEEECGALINQDTIRLIY